MSLLAHIPAAAIETILGQLFLFYLPGANGDRETARQAALAGLLAYQPRTEPELALAAEIIGYRYHARESMRQAAEPDLATNQMLRLVTAATRLGREALRGLVKLEQMQRVRRDASEPEAPPVEAEPVAAEPPQPAPEPAATPSPAAPSPARYAHLSKEAIRKLSPAQQKRAYLERITESTRRRQAEQAACAPAMAAE
jgi:hypothetical protein